MARHALTRRRIGTGVAASLLLPLLAGCPPGGGGEDAWVTGVGLRPAGTVTWNSYAGATSYQLVVRAEDTGRPLGTWAGSTTSAPWTFGDEGRFVVVVFALRDGRVQATSRVQVVNLPSPRTGASERPGGRQAGAGT
ncbi:hypothetical protein [Spirilliplanes yamanashiensis]|uniref:Uncharacterized protein n=1 Tax=Spirilliplanes yamanashiensis TaxID=42233 RepID=A0A8J3YEN8_9ACTN|nr:hypothetical protein [Spirilliplanes yamanashiensis]MDP9818329.1 hypothetical protein [Spirilliplanes yamanashiensis]GIJ06549.1 hypothetical protein Sya03_59010 [Spirilliplanes yamanashiensis]